MSKRVNRTEFITSHGATCQNWRWSWSFVNHKDKVVIFGAWDIYVDEVGERILDEGWQWNAKGGRKQPGYAQSIEHIRLIEDEGYALRVFRMDYWGPKRDERKSGAAVIEGFTPKLESRQLKKVGSRWYAIK